MLFVLSLLAACSPTCGSLEAGAERDRCVYEEVQEGLPTLTAVELEQVTLAMEDPIYRSTLVLEWVRYNRGKVREADRDRACGLLDGIERHHCVRDLMAAHLNR